MEFWADFPQQAESGVGMGCCSPLCLGGVGAGDWVREGDSGRSRGRVRCENETKKPNIVFSSYAVRNRISFFSFSFFIFTSQ